MKAWAPVVAEAVSKDFRELEAVRHLNLTVDAGTIVGLIGPSGCGKTTTVRLLTGGFRPTEGQVRLLGVDPTMLSTRQKRRIGYLPQIPIQFPALTVWENLNFNASLYGMGLRRRRSLGPVLDFVELSGHEHKRVDEISGGMQRRLALAAVLAHDPEVLFLDEPTAGIDPILRRKFWDRFRELRDAGRTFVITTQHVAEAAYCDVVGVMSDGELIALDTPEALRREACGGEVIELSTTVPLSAAALAELSGHPAVCGQVRRSGETTVQATVSDATTALPDFIAEIQTHGVEVERSSEVTPDYDEVFIRLVERHRAAQAPEEAPAR